MKDFDRVAQDTRRHFATPLRLPDPNAEDKAYEKHVQEQLDREAECLPTK